MVARLAKNIDAGSGLALSVRAIEENLNVLVAPEAQTVRTALSTAENEVDRLYEALATVTPDEHPRTARLLASSTRKVAQKIIEEAGEVALATVKRNQRGIVRESADLLYHLAVLWRRSGVSSGDIWLEMRRRAENLGIAEKLPKA